MPGFRFPLSVPESLRELFERIRELLPQLELKVLPNRPVYTTETVIAHGLNSTPVFVVTGNPHCIAVVRNVRRPDAKNVYLRATNPCVVNVWTLSIGQLGKSIIQDGGYDWPDWNPGQDDHLVKARFSDATAVGGVYDKTTNSDTVIREVVTESGVEKVKFHAGDGASWTGVRYIFLDGDNGNDANLGYIDAPAGTEFTPAQTTAVAVKTTHRINEIRPKNGNGRMCVVLLKPRANRAKYDHETAGDGLGMDDRSGSHDYSYLLTRGSDHTNSWADKMQLGFVTTFPGTNPDGSFTVSSYSENYDEDDRSAVFRLTGATLPTQPAILRYRVRGYDVSADWSDYLPVKWASTTDTDRNVVTTWVQPQSDYVAGDKLFFESPGVVLDAFYEAAAYSPTAGYAGGGTLAGVEIASWAYFGTDSDVSPTTLCCVVCSQTSAPVVDGSGRAQLRITGDYIDELLNYVADDGSEPWTFETFPVNVVGFGLIAPSIQAVLGSLLMRYSFLGIDSDNAGSSSITADTLFIRESAIKYGRFQNGAERQHFYNVITGAISVYAPVHANFNTIRPVNDWVCDCDGPVINVIPSTLYDRKFDHSAASFCDMHNVMAAAGVAEPNKRGIYVDAGPAVITLDHGSTESDWLNAGNGVAIHGNFQSSPWMLVSWQSLRETGFEIIGGQKLVCRKYNASRNFDLLPCPRAAVTRMVKLADRASPIVKPVGLAVYSAPDNRVEFAEATTDAKSRVLGVTVTNVVRMEETGYGGTDANAANWVLVGLGDVMMIQAESGSSAPGVGALMYLSETDPGAYTLTPPVRAVLLGIKEPNGTASATGPTSVVWKA